MAGPGRPVTGPGRTRGRLPANWAQRIALQQAQTPADPIKIPKKRGPKPGSKVAVRVVFIKRAPRVTLDAQWWAGSVKCTGEPLKRQMSKCVCAYTQRKPRVVPNPVPTSPTTSTPEPDTSTVPLDNATIPNSALQAPTGTAVDPVLDPLHIMLLMAFPLWGVKCMCVCCIKFSLPCPKFYLMDRINHKTFTSGCSACSSAH